MVHTFPDHVIEAGAIAIFDHDESLNLQMIAEQDAAGNRAYGDGLGRERDSWDNPANVQCQDAYRRRALACLIAAEIATIGGAA